MTTPAAPGARSPGAANYVANTAVTWPGRLRQSHAYFGNRPPGQMLATAAPGPAPATSRLQAELLECRLASFLSRALVCARKRGRCPVSASDRPTSAQALPAPRCLGGINDR